MMNIVCIFERTKDCLYAVKYEGQELDALEFLQQEWSDIERLRKFFKQYKRDYDAYFPKASIPQIVEKTIDDADLLFELLFDLAETESGKDLGSFFKPLENQEIGTAYELQALKAYGPLSRSFLRIYAIRYGKSFVITGGAIKLTGKMQDRPHTKTELYKLQLVKNYLSQSEEAEFVYLDIENDE